jgi:hypothetical protein
MATTIDKLKDLDYDEIVALAVIEKDEDLNEIFTDEVKMSYNMLRTLSKEGKLSEGTQDFIRQLFDKVILTKSSLINKYVLLAEADGKTIGEVQSVPVEELKVEVEVVEEPKPKKDKKEKTLPRRYGCEKVLADIEAQDGKATSAQLASLSVNKIKNYYVSLDRRLIKKMLTGDKTLTDVDCRKIISAVTTFERLIEEIIKKK